MADLSDLAIRLSGGASNTDPAAALGGVMSTVAGGIVDSQTASAPTTLTGVVIDDAAGNTLGDGTLAFNSTNTTLTWTPPSGFVGSAVDVSSNGTYAIQGASNSGYVVVTVTASSLPGSDITNTITITANDNNLFDDVAKADALAGDTEYRCVYLENTHGTDSVIATKVWIDTNTPGQDVIAIALDPAGKNGTATTIGDEDTAPAGVDFSAVNPIDEASALSMGDLAAGDQYPFWIRRTVPANTTTTTTGNTFRLAIRVNV